MQALCHTFLQTATWRSRKNRSNCCSPCRSTWCSTRLRACWTAHRCVTPHRHWDGQV